MAPPPIHGLRQIQKPAPRKQKLHTLVEGILAGELSRRPGIPLAISLGGRVEAVARTYGTRGHFAAMLPGKSTRRGRGRLGVFEILERDGNLRLRGLQPPKDLKGNAI